MLVSKAVTETEVQASGADTGAVVPIGKAVMTATSLSEADIVTIVDRVTRNLQPSILGGAPVCPTLSEGEGEAVMLISVTVRPKPNLSKLENYGIDNLVVVPSM